MTDTREQRIPEIMTALPSEYSLVDPSWESVADASQVVPIGAGGSSVVLPALYRGRLRRAIKVFLPRPDLAATLDMTHFLASYDNEVVRQASLSHEHVSKITDFTTVQLRTEVYPFIATEFVDGINLRDFARAADSGAAILNALTDVLSGLSYLHRNRVIHCDIKQDNILVKTDETTGKSSAIIVDLGSSRFIPAKDEGTEDELLHLFTTTRYVLSRLRLLVANWTQNRISRKELRTYFPYLDIHAFGIVLKDLLDEQPVRRKLAAAAANEDVFDYILSKLTNPRPGRDYFQTADDVQTALQRLSYRSLAPLGVPELSPTPRKGVVIPGLRGRVHGGGRVDRVMSHPLFQRFHLLPQLDLLFWTLPGATNTRYVHAAHAFDITRNALAFTLNDWQFRQEISNVDIESTLYSALFNQIGHYHFLHMFEDFIEERGTESRVQDAQLLRDDELLDSILGIRPSDLGAELATIRDERGRTLPQILESLDLEWPEVRRRQRDPQSPLEGVLAALLSGPLDVEKLAYLKDDSLATGVQFGVGLDGTPVFESMVIPKFEDWKSNVPAQRIALGITEQAMAYLEYGVLTRYWNIQTVYWNRTNRAVQSMLKFQLACLIRSKLLDFHAYVKETLHMGPDGALRWIDVRFRAARANGEIDPETVNPMEDLLESRRSIYRRLLTISGRSRIPGRDPDHKIFRRVQALSPLDDTTVSAIVAEALKQVDSRIRIAPGDVLVDLPRSPRDETHGRVLVYTEDSHEYMGELFKISPNLQQHQESFDQYVKRMRIFVHPRVHEPLRKSGQLQRAYDSTLEALRGAFAN